MMQNQFITSETSAEVTPYVVPTLYPSEETAEGVTVAEELQTAASTQAVTNLLNRAQHKIHRRRQSYLAVFGLCLVMFFSGLSMMSHADNHSFCLLLLFMFFLPSFLITLLIMCMPVSLDIPRLEREGGLRAVSTLLDAFNMSSITGHRKSIMRALTTLLPQLRASDANLLTPSNRHTLNVLLGSSLLPSKLGGVDHAFALAVLKAYEQVGDAKAVPVVERLANCRPRNTRQREIQKAAAECLPLLRANVGEVASTQTLLRASTCHVGTPDTLLRPAASLSSIPPAELLRPTQADDTPSA